MAIRVVRHIAGRAVTSDDAKLLAAIPYGAGERLRHIRCDAYAGARADTAADQPGEINWIAIDVPWSIILTSETAAYQGGTAGLNEASEWDQMFRNLVLEYGTDGNEYYGGDYDAGQNDPIPAPGEEPQSTGDSDEPLIQRSKGPSGIVRLFAREVLTRPLLSEGNQAVRFFDEWNQAFEGRAMRESGGCVLIGVVRYDTPVETNWGVEFTSGGAKALGPLIGGDSSRVQEYIQNNTGEIGDRLRTMLFGGDNYIESATVKADDMKAYLKCWASIESPYSMGVM